MLPVRLFLSVLHDLLHDVFQGLGRFVLSLPGGKLLQLHISDPGNGGGLLP